MYFVQLRIALFLLPPKTTQEATKMTSKVTEGHLLPKEVSNRLETVLGRDTEGIYGISTPRIHTPLNDLPSKGHELIDLAADIGVDLMDWQKFALIHTHKVKPDGRWASPVNTIVVARQNGKSLSATDQNSWRVVPLGRTVADRVGAPSGDVAGTIPRAGFSDRRQ